MRVDNVFSRAYGTVPAKLAQRVRDMQTGRQTNKPNGKPCACEKVDISSNCTVERLSGVASFLVSQVFSVEDTGYTSTFSR